MSNLFGQTQSTNQLFGNLARHIPPTSGDFRTAYNPSRDGNFLAPWSSAATGNLPSQQYGNFGSTTSITPYSHSGLGPTQNSYTDTVNRYNTRADTRSMFNGRFNGGKYKKSRKGRKSRKSRKSRRDSYKKRY